MTTFETRLMRVDDWNAVARLIHSSLNIWYEKNRGFRLVSGTWETMLLFPRVYEALDPGCCVLVEETSSKRVAGTCFFHPRSTHVALGIMNTHPDFFGSGVASQMLRYVIDDADRRKLPVRLVSGATNVDSFSLYNRAGFVPTRFFQDMTVTVPEEGFDIDVPPGWTLRDATPDDIPQIVALERELSHIEREKDYHFFLRNDGGIWHMSVLTGPEGELGGFLVSVNDPGSNMLGPGLARDEALAAALVRGELNFHRGCSPVWLIPSCSRSLVDAMYALGAKNCELHITQVLGDYTPETGIVFPTFMPETG
jgi:GNAT superfamily N-acetyltransferase